ncbi:MAG: hypothetical protein AMQ74_01845 [Candidatus Methanofastidiosum methylothiophilum]|uniref:Uncharacterized protein n=1 Tax=Candidatus Methanofastidiosum methylothiophilum TaxID=1705564 RepID=A0A150IN10_9EURY|nr:MAG: hypothetical protein AMQ74_01845 [Candidatus Methanofastidiosum methylthiophilus]
MFTFVDEKFEERFSDFVLDRIDDCLMKAVLPQDEKQKLSECSQKICEAVKPELWETYLTWEKLSNEKAGLEQEACYRQGFSDGIKFVLGGLINE